ncbi:YDG/SRA domain-containing protein [Colletotrichum abscissum]|uniref:YDG/SRA domain-containing protein n=1 Tax=Colletotrichum abscissum TaxID=1671311 RepID=A0A9Q0BAX5_9PEZI|nr:YDG/SRA domain-containing protein [Colletotrichum abscissum]
MAHKKRLGMCLFKISLASQACLKPSNNRRGINEVGACYPGLAFGVTWETTTTPRASRSLIPALESPCPPKNLSQLSAMWYGGHGESNAGISYMRGPNGEPGPVISIIMADKYSDIDVDRGDGIIYCGSNSLDNTSSNTPADGGPPVRGNAALFKPTEKNIRLVRICSKNPERVTRNPDQVVGGYLQDLPDLEDLPDLDDLDAHLRDPSSFAFTGAEQSINFHTSFEGMPPNGPADQCLGPTVLPETEQVNNNSNGLSFSRRSYKRYSSSRLWARHWPRRHVDILHCQARRT